MANVGSDLTSSLYCARTQEMKRGSQCAATIYYAPITQHPSDTSLQLHSGSVLNFTLPCAGLYSDLCIGQLHLSVDCTGVHWATFCTGSDCGRATFGRRENVRGCGEIIRGETLLQCITAHSGALYCILM